VKQQTAQPGPLRTIPGGNVPPGPARPNASGLTPAERAAMRRRQRDRRRFVRLASDVLDRRDRNRRGGDVRPDSCRPLGQNDLHVPDPTGIAAVRRITGDYPHDPVAKRLAEDERDLARLAARMGATTPIIISHMYGAPDARFAR